MEYYPANKFKTGDKYLMLNSLGQVKEVVVSDDPRYFNDGHGTKCESVKVTPNYEDNK